MKLTTVRTIFLLAAFVLSTFIVTHAATLAAGKASAQTTKAIDLVVTPPVEYVSLKPGESLQHRVVIEQKGQIPIEVTPHLVSFESDGISNKPLLKSESDFKQFSLELPIPQIDTSVQLPLSDNTTQSGPVPTKGFVLQPGEKKTVGVTFNTLPSSLEKEYPLTLLFFAKAQEDDLTINSSQTKVQGAIGSNIVLLVSNSDRNRGNITIESIQPPRIIDSLSDLHFSILAKNTGPHATQASGSAKITNWQGTEVAQFMFFPDMILANTSRLLRTAGSNDSNNIKNIEDLDPTAVSSTFRYKPFFLLGPYTITASIENEVQSITVFALPYSIIIVLATLVLGWVFFSIFKLYSHSEHTKNSTDQI